MPAAKDRLVQADRPFFARREDFDDIKSMTSATYAQGDLSVGRYQRRRTGLGITEPNPESPSIMAVVILRPRPAHLGWQNGREVLVPNLGTGALTCLDLRETWTMDLSDPFDSFHAFIPLDAFDRVADELGRPRIDRLNRLISVEQRDETMLGLAQALNPLLGSPSEASALFADYVFAAMTTHLAVTYGGIGPLGSPPDRAARKGKLTLQQERRLTSRLLDDLKGDPSLAELAALAGLSQSQLLRAFKATLGMPPHRWLLAQRVRRAKALMLGTGMSIGEVALECGFADQSHMTRVFSRIYGVTPGAWRRQWKD